VGASNCSPLLLGGYLYSFSGPAGCLRADSGEVVYQERLTRLGPEYSPPATRRIFLSTRPHASLGSAARSRAARSHRPRSAAAA
jgi:hypothetical protein